jgi:hypothetical protein
MDDITKEKSVGTETIKTNAERKPLVFPFDDDEDEEEEVEEIEEIQYEQELREIVKDEVHLMKQEENSKLALQKQKKRKLSGIERENIIESPRVGRSRS